uniref:Uncharacterized protein n=1 Tax=Zea mays TaxID=4577 RepID=A0A804MV99_MAIZE
MGDSDAPSNPSRRRHLAGGLLLSRRCLSGPPEVRAARGEGGGGASPTPTGGSGRARPPRSPWYGSSAWRRSTAQVLGRACSGAWGPHLDPACVGAGTGPSAGRSEQGTSHGGMDDSAGLWRPLGMVELAGTRAAARKTTGW